MEWSTSTRSPKLYGKGGPPEIAEATADFKKSIDYSRCCMLFALDNILCSVSSPNGIGLM